MQVFNLRLIHVNPTIMIHNINSYKPRVFSSWQEFLNVLFMAPFALPKGSFAIITASNPNGVVLPRRDNHLLRLKLVRTLRYTHVRCQGLWGVSPDLSHAEYSFVVRCSLAKALWLGRCFEQIAIYWFDGNRLWLVYCQNPTKPLPMEKLKRYWRVAPRIYRDLFKEF